ncbi:MAG TPA: TonB-dependent receptor [Caulobacterales bacterium]|nr:TonB-dependent receptor [Caulobacterales bacterium]
MTRAVDAFKASSLLALAFCLATPAFAQEAQGEDEIVVTGIRASLRDAIGVKRNSPLVVEAISSNEIGQLPDVTIAESLVRLPGLNGTRDRGNASQAAIRGLGPRLVLGLVNGREVASSEPDRNVRWEIYPSEVVTGAQVYKSQSANLIAGGVAGTVDIQTVRPLDYQGPSLNGRAGPVYYDGSDNFPNYDPWGYRASGSYVAHISPQFAVALGVSLQNQKNGYPSFQGWGYNDERLGGNPGDINGDSVLDHTPWGAQTEIKMLDEDRTGVMGAAQWRPNNDFTLSFDALYSKVEIDEHQNQAWYGRNGTTGNWGGANNGDYNAAGSSYTIVGGDVVAATLPFVEVTNVIAQYTEDKDLVATGLNGEYVNGGWTFKGDLSYSRATRENTWQAVQIPIYPASMSFDMRAGVTPFVTTSSNPADTSIQFVPNWLGGTHDGPEHITDELSAAAFSANYDMDGFIDSVEGGVRLSDRSKHHDRISWQQFSSGVAIPANMLTNYEVTAFDVPPILDGDFYALANLAYGGFVEPPGQTSMDYYKDGYWTVDEQVAEAYGMANFQSELFGLPMTGNAGVRIVDVETSSFGYEHIGGAAATPVTIKNDYTEVLPSLSLNFHLSDDQVLRVGLAKVISRPPLDELRAGRSISDPGDPPPLTGFGGNPRLDPFRATQLDLSYEYYFHPEALLAVAVYAKDVDSNIGYFTSPQQISGETYQMTGPANGDGGMITGLELTFQTPFYFVPGLSDFGIYSNYAYVNSDIKEFYPWYNPVDGSGMAEHTATVDLWYSHGGLEARLGYKYHSEYTVIYGWNGSDIRTLEPEGVWDFSTSYQINDHIGLRFQVNNLNDEPLRIYRDNDPDRLGRYDVYGRRFLFDISFRY